MLPLTFFTRVRDWPRLPSAHPNWDGGPHQKKINRENLKCGLKFSVWATVTSGLMGVSSRNFFQSTCRKAGVIMWVPFSEGPSPKIWEGEKTSKIWRDSWQLSILIAIIFGTHRHVESWKNHHQLQPIPRWTKKIWWTLVHKQQSYSGSYWPTQVDIFRETTFRPLGVAAPQISKHVRDWPRLPSAHPNWDGGPPQKKINLENSKFGLGLKFSVWASIASLLVGISLINLHRRRDELWSTKKKVIARI